MMKTKVSKLLLLAAMFALPLCVSAEEAKPSDFNDEQTVVVGEVDTTVYSVEIQWTDLSYDWKYDKDTNDFKFMPSLACQAVTGNALQDYITSGETIYSDNTCATLHTGEYQNENTYYVQNGFFPTVQVEDYSVNGKIKAKASFAPSGSFANWVTGKFYEYTTYDNKKIEYHNELTDGYLKSNPITSGEGGTGNILGYLLTGTLKLEVNNEYTGEKVVETGNTIGTVTLEISEDTN